MQTLSQPAWRRLTKLSVKTSRRLKPIRQSVPAGKEVLFEDGDMVWILTQHFQPTRQLNKLDYKRTGPYTVCKVIHNPTYKYDLPQTIRKHNIFYVSLLDRYTPPSISQPPTI